MRRFHAKDGAFLPPERKGGAGSCYAEAFSSEIRSRAYRRLGELMKRPNLQQAVRNRKLSDTDLRELQRMAGRLGIG